MSTMGRWASNLGAGMSALLFCTVVTIWGLSYLGVPSIAHLGVGWRSEVRVYCGRAYRLATREWSTRSIEYWSWDELPDYDMGSFMDDYIYGATSRRFVGGFGRA